MDLPASRECGAIAGNLRNPADGRPVAAVDRHARGVFRCRVSLSMTIRSWRRFARSARRCSPNAAGSRRSFFGGCVKGSDCRRQQGESLSMDRWRTRQPRPRRHGRAHRPRRREYPIQARSVSDGIPRLAPGACMRGDLVAGATGFLIDRGGGGRVSFRGGFERRADPF